MNSDAFRNAAHSSIEENKSYQPFAFGLGLTLAQSLTTMIQSKLEELSPTSPQATCGNFFPPLRQIMARGGKKFKKTLKTR